MINTYTTNKRIVVATIVKKEKTTISIKYIIV